MTKKVAQRRGRKPSNPEAYSLEGAENLAMWLTIAETIRLFQWRLDNPHVAFTHDGDRDSFEAFVERARVAAKQGTPLDVVRAYGGDAALAEIRDSLREGSVRPRRGGLNLGFGPTGLMQSASPPERGAIVAALVKLVKRWKPSKRSALVRPNLALWMSMHGALRLAGVAQLPAIRSANRSKSRGAPAYVLDRLGAVSTSTSTVRWLHTAEPSDTRTEFVAWVSAALVACNDDSRGEAVSLVARMLSMTPSRVAQLDFASRRDGSAQALADASGILSESWLGLVEVQSSN